MAYKKHFINISSYLFKTLHSVFAASQGRKGTLMKKVFAITFIALFVLAVVWLIIEGSRPEVLPVWSKLPSIEYAGFSGIQKLKADSTRKTVVIFFSEECPHCKYELKVLNENADKLKGANFILITLDKGL